MIKISDKKLPILYIITAFFGASLLFMVQPLVTKLLLPSFGGAATLWATANLFFQLILLGSYIFTHLSSRLTAKKQGAILFFFVALSLFSLPITFDSNISLTVPAVLKVIITLALIVGLPFAVIATTGPMLQRWYSLSKGPRHNDPYFIYAASNIGSFIGLFSYPFIIEPYLSLTQQGWLWSSIFIVFILLLVVCWTTIVKADNSVPTNKLFTNEISLKRKVKWIGLAFIPSSLMLGFTTYIATDVGSFPLLWVIPLGVYLLTMITAFARKSRQVHQGFIIAACVSALVACYSFYTKIFTITTAGLIAASIMTIIALFIIGYTCHALLAADRPEPRNLTSFYVLVSLGGACGGIFNGFIAPVIFNNPIELYLVLILVPISFLVKNTKTFAAASTLMMILSLSFFTINNKSTILKTRTFYGAYTVTANDTHTYFNSGTTLHGMQNKEKPLEPTTYYARTGPIGSLFSIKDYTNVAAVGLGAGTIAAYGTPQQKITFFEIDNAVKEIAENTKYFTFIKDSPSEIKIEINDGRLGVKELPDESIDLLILDAFSSDSIPTHLLTQEAFQEYWKKMTPDGVIAIHVSNRFFDLRPVVGAAAQDADVPLLMNFDTDLETDETQSLWLVITKDKAIQESLKSKDWDVIKPPAEKWTDDYVPLLKSLNK